MSNIANDEFEAIRAVHTALEPLDEEARTRVLTYISSLLGVDPPVVATGGGSADEDLRPKTGEPEIGQVTGQASTFSDFADLFAAADPKTGGEKALVAGYWLQECQGAESFTGAAAHKELKNLGHGLTNITEAIDSMKARKPMLILQLRKSGSSRQARKLYKISRAGATRVEEMISG